MQIKSEKHGISEIDITQLTGMSTAEARSLIWPFKGIRKPMGVLLEQGEITIRDIAWAAENAYDARLKQAAKTILLSRVFPEKVGDSLKPAKTVSGGNYTAYQRRIAIFWGSLTSGIVLGIGLLYVAFLIFGWLQKTYVEYFDLHKNMIYQTYGIVLFLVTPLILIWLSVYFINQSDQYALGEEAEEQAFDALRALLREPWVIVHNFKFPDRKWGDVDLIVLGPGGVWAIEVKGYTNQIRVTGDNWHYKNKFGWWRLSKHPSKQARRNAARLKSYLDARGINIGWVEPVVLWAGEEKNLLIEDPETVVWKLSELPNMESFWQKQRLNDDQVRQVFQILEDSLEKVKAKSGKR